MRKEKKWVYYCEFCKKSGRSGGHIAKHEKRCTMNPNRHCGMCAMDDDIEQVPMPGLLAVLPDVTDCWTENRYGRSFMVPDSFKEAFSNLREKVENCPACLLAALRQKGIPVGAVEGFNFKQECDSWWGTFSEEQRDRGYGY